MNCKMAISAGVLFVGTSVGASAVAAPLVMNGKNSHPHPLLELQRQISIAGGATYQNYKEEDGGHTLDKETGWMPNVRINASWLYDNNVYVDMDTTYSFGDSDYDGHLVSDGSPYEGTTKNDIVSVDLKAGYAIQPGANVLFIPYLTYGHRYWNRDLGGQIEKYNMNYLGAGAKLDYEVNPRLIARFDAMIGGTFATDMDAGTGKSFDLGSKAVAKLGAGLDYRLRDHWHTFGNVRYTHFAFGRSDSQRVGNLYVYEPESKTNNVSLDVGVRYTF